MRAILLIALTVVACGCDDDVTAGDMGVDMTAIRGEFCGDAPGQTRCCTDEKVGESCTTGDSCKYPVFCAPGYLACEGAVWVHMGPDSCDMAMPPTD